MRKFAKTLAVVSVMTPAGVNALGVGEIKLHSALNQKLYAEIPLLVSPGEDISQIRVSLAPPNAFSKAGLTRPYYLSNLRFKPVKKSDGTVVVQVTSSDVIREPFLDFLLEVDWPQGRMLREFTVLLDPPITFEDVVTVAQSKPAAEKSGNQAQSRPPASTVKQKAQETIAVPGSEYGPVKRNESLWAIAKKLKPQASVTTEQMAMALFNANPGAFYNNNVNELKAGVTLKVPEASQVVQLSPSQARREFQQQYQTWIARRQQSTHSGSKPLTVAEEANRLKLEAPREADIQEAQSELPVIEMPGQDNPKTLEMIESLRQENDLLRQRLEDLEKRMTALMEIKNAQLAQLQNAGARQNQEKTLDQSKTIEEQSKGTQQGEKIASVPTAEKQSLPVVTPKPVKPAEQAKPTPKPVSVPKPVQAGEESDFSVSVFSNPLYLGIGSFSFMLLGVAGFLIWRRRVAAEEQADSLLADSFLMDLEEEEQQQENITAPSPASDKQPQAAAVSASAPVEESSFLSEFTPSDFDILETESDAVDPVAEADVYLAYGRYQQAEELIQQALEDEPKNPELQLKLLEIFYAKEDAEAFENYASKLQAKGRHKDGLFWAKVAEMGRELCPQSSLFDLDSEEATLVEDDWDSEEESADSIDLEADLDEQVNDQESLAFDLGDEAVVDFSADSPEDEFADDENKSLEIEASESSDNALDFDLSGINLDPESKGAEAPGEESVDEPENSDFTFNLESMGIQGQNEESDETEEEAFDLTDMDEMETKLDLARAYVDMEDVDSAKDILEDVFAHGNEKQKEEAKALMGKLGMAS
ncbi:MAG: hypothetical protein AXA67_01935 [Methylothermaceae bacteria B42]|nr:MAG: hypothetical protein AXA67_01935 [Methylothermaceae bacteria B42]HHJ37870.1 hypothetical protein [Methylothermaceae bacterium]